MLHISCQLDQTVFHLLEEIHLDSRKRTSNIYIQDFTCSSFFTFKVYSQKLYIFRGRFKIWSLWLFWTHNPFCFTGFELDCLYALSGTGWVKATEFTCTVYPSLHISTRGESKIKIAFEFGEMCITTYMYIGLFLHLSCIFFNLVVKMFFVLHFFCIFCFHLLFGLDLCLNRLVKGGNTLNWQFFYPRDPKVRIQIKIKRLYLSYHNSR